MTEIRKVPKKRKIASELDKIKSIITKHKDTFCLVAFSEEEDYYLVTKKQNFTIHSINENNIFMPYEKKEDKEVPLLFLLTFGKCKRKTPLVSNIKLLNSVKIVMLPKRLYDLEYTMLGLKY